MRECKKCNKFRRRRMSPYGMSSGVSWICPCDGCFSPDYWNINQKRQRQKNKKEVKEQLGEK